MKNILRLIINEIKNCWSWRSAWDESMKARAEWYRREIIAALEARDFERAAFLQREELNGYGRRPI